MGALPMSYGPCEWVPLAMRPPIASFRRGRAGGLSVVGSLFIGLGRFMFSGRRFRGPLLRALLRTPEELWSAIENSA